MGKIWRLLLLALLVNATLATVTLARPVFLADGGIIQAQRVWKEEGRIYVLLNRDSLITFSPEELDLKKTFARKWKNAPLHSGHSSVTNAVVTAPVAPAVAIEAKAPAATPAAPVPTAKAPTAAQVSTPAPAAPPVAVSPPPPAKATPPPPAVAQPAPRPRPAPAPPAPPADESPMMGVAVLGGVLLFALVILASIWKVFTKAGEAGWKSLIPIYNFFVLLRIAGCPSWWFLMFLIPVVNLYFMVVMYIRLAEKFGKGALFGFALCFLGFIFFPILAFGPATYGEEEGTFTFDEG